MTEKKDKFSNPVARREAGLQDAISRNFEDRVQTGNDQAETGLAELDSPFHGSPMIDLEHRVWPF